MTQDRDIGFAIYQLSGAVDFVSDAIIPGPITAEEQRCLMAECSRLYALVKSAHVREEAA